MDEYRWTCFECGEPGHIKAGCPHRPAPHPPPPHQGSAHAANHPPPFRDMLAILRRPIEEIADPAPYADAIRRHMGWKQHGEDGRRQRALAQAAESRQARGEGTWHMTSKKENAQ